VPTLLTLATAAWLLAAPATVRAAGPTNTILLVTKSGCYELTIDAAGTPTVIVAPKQYSQVILLGDQPGPSPNPVPPPIPPDPTPGPLTPRGLLIKAAAEKVTGDPNRAATAQGLAMLYRAIAEQKVTDQATLDSVLISTTNMLLLQQKATEQWKPYISVFNTQWTVARSKGIDDCLALLKESAAGLDASAPQKAISPEFLQFIMQLITLLISLFAK